MSLNLAGCVIRDETGNIYLLHRNKNGFTQWELPGGKVEDGEAIEDAAMRELHEELGVRVSLSGKLGETRFVENDLEHFYTWFLAEIDEGVLAIGEPETFDDLQSFSLEELVDLQPSNNMKKLHESLASGEVSLTLS